MSSKKVVITGGPGTGKTAIISHLKTMGLFCFNEISREITLQARAEGIEQLFLTEPLRFSDALLDGRIRQFNNAKQATTAFVFLDRGIPDVIAYMDYIGDAYPNHFDVACKTYKYDIVFSLAPWKAIFKSDSERYENFEQAQRIHHHLVATYKRYGYQLIAVPFVTVAERCKFIINALNNS